MDISIKPTTKGVHLYFSEDGRNVSDFLLTWKQVEWLKEQLSNTSSMYADALIQELKKGGEQ